MDIYLLHLNYFIEAMRLFSKLAEVDPSLQNFVGRDRAWPQLWTNMGGLIYENPPGFDRK